MSEATVVDISEAAVSDCLEKIEDGQDTGAPAALVRALRDALTAAQAELHQYRLTVQLGCSVDAEVWHQLRMKMDAALGPDFDPYVRGECFAALDAIVKQRDEARATLTAAESRIKELEAESAKHYSMAVAMFYSGKVDDLTGPDCRKAAKTIQTMLAQEAVEYPKCPSCGGRAAHWSDCERFPS